MSTQEQPVTASLVAEAQRLDFLPTYFGPRLMMRGEALVYAWLRRLWPAARCGGYQMCRIPRSATAGCGSDCAAFDRYCSGVFPETQEAKRNSKTRQAH